MKANELRIGNWIKADSGLSPNRGLIHEWQISMEDMIHICNNFEQGNGKRYKPIPLTEKWLLDFGLDLIGVIQGLNHYWFDDTGLFSLRKSKYNDKAYDLIVHSGINETIYLMSFDYVHQLQNIIPSLTQKELTLK